VLGSIINILLCVTARAQEQPPATAQVQTEVSQADARNLQPCRSHLVLCRVRPSAPQPNWTFQSLSYLWFPGMNGTGRRAWLHTPAHTSVQADVLRNTDIGIMGAFEADHHRWGCLSITFGRRSPIIRRLSISPAIPRRSQSNRASLPPKRPTSLWIGKGSKSGRQPACACGI